MRAGTFRERSSEDLTIGPSCEILFIRRISYILWYVKLLLCYSAHHSTAFVFLHSRPTYCQMKDRVPSPHSCLQVRYSATHAHLLLNEYGHLLIVVGI